MDLEIVGLAGTPQLKCLKVSTLKDRRIFLAENWRRRSKFEEVQFIFPNAPNIPITLVCNPSGVYTKKLLTMSIEHGYAHARMV
jgi:hypothetical protein